MSAFTEALKKALAVLEETKAKYALVGALAVGIHSMPRQTADIDFALLIPPSASPDAVLDAFILRGFGIRERDGEASLGEVDFVRLYAPEGDGQLISIDLLVNLSGIEGEVVAAARPVEVWPGVTAQIATRSHLLAMKTLSQNATYRSLDRTDIFRLLDDATPEEVDCARRAIALVEGRGFAPGRDLSADFEAFVRAHRQAKSRQPA